MGGIGFILEIISIVFFTQSLNATKVFMQTNDPNLFASVKSKGTIAKVFFVIVCIRLGFTLVIGVGALAILMGDNGITVDTVESMEALFAISSVGIVFSIVVFIVGVSAVVKYKQAQKTYSILAPKFNAMNKGFDAANPFGDLPTGNNGGENSRNDNGSYSRTNVNNANFSGANPQAGVNTQSTPQNNFNTNDPTRLRSVTDDQSPFEAPPPVYTNYNYGNGNVNGSYRQMGTTPTPYNRQNGWQYNRQNTYQQPVNNSSNYRQPAKNPPNSQAAANSVNGQNLFSPANSAPANQKNTYSTAANAKITEPKQYVSQMPEVTPFSASEPSTAARQEPVIPVVLPNAVEIEREPTVRCKHCGVTNKAKDKFCTFCGKSLTD